MGQKIYLYTINPLYINSYSILVDFYMPLISNQAISLYYYLENKAKENIKVLEMENIISETKFDPTKILMIRKYLEAVELINTYKDNNEELHIVLNGVKSPKQLLTDIRFKTLIESIKNKEEIEKLKEKYNLNLDLESKFENISSSFSDCFNLSIKNDKSVVESKIFLPSNDEFKDKVIKYFKTNSNIDTSTCLNNENIKKLYDISSLFGLNEEEIAYYAIRFFDPSLPNYFDFDKMIFSIKKEISFHKVFKNNNNKKIKINSDTEFANLINKYESTSPRIFLKEKQNGIEVVRSDLNLLLTLRNNLSLSNGVINCLIDYCLKTKNGELNSDYVLKIAATLIRKNITNSLDCYNYFYNKKIEKVKNINEEQKNKEDKNIENDKILLDLTGDDEESLF